MLNLLTLLHIKATDPAELPVHPPQLPLFLRLLFMFLVFFFFLPISKGDYLHVLDSVRSLVPRPWNGVVPSLTLSL